MSELVILRAAIFRILDANLNRAREALRVMEEHARFVLDDTLLSTDLKHTRHRLARSVPQEIAEHLLACRDVEGDVGRESSEMVRANSEHVRPGTCPPRRRCVAQ